MVTTGAQVVGAVINDFQEIVLNTSKSHLNKIQISGITDAIAELNTMHGFNESNVNINSAVSFVGEEDLED